MAQVASSSDYAEPTSRIEKLKQLRSRCVSELEYEIESSKEHWTEPDSGASECLSEEALVAENREVFERLMEKWRSPATGLCFFHDWGDSLKVGKKIAEGGQAEIFAAELQIEDYRSRHEEIVVKVFKSGYSLKDLERMWSRGMFSQQSTDEIKGEDIIKAITGNFSGRENFKPDFHSEDTSNLKGHDIPTYFIHEYCCFIHGGTLLKNGRFAFVLGRYWGDLRKLIDLKRRESTEYRFRSHQVLGQIMLEIAKGMQKLHSYGILHRDLKASNVLVQHVGYWPDHNVSWRVKNFDEPIVGRGKGYTLDVADFESSVGTIGTRFWRAPEVLCALENRLHDPRWTRKGDVYGYAMTCYEVMTGCIPFEDVEISANDVINGARPLWRDIDNINDDLHQIVIRCWHPIPFSRPSFDLIVKKLLKYDLNQKDVPPSPKDRRKTLFSKRDLGE